MSRALGMLTHELSLRMRVYLAAVITIVAVAGSFAFNLRAQKQLADTTRHLLEDRVSAMETAQRLKEALVSHNNTILRYLATRDRLQLGAAQDERESARAELKHLNSLASNPVIRARLDTLNTEMERYFTDAKRLLDYSSSHDLPADAGLFRAAEWARQQSSQRREMALLSADGQARLTRVFSLCEEVVTFHRAELARAQSEMDGMFDHSLKAALTFVAATGSLVLLVALGLAVSLIGSFRALSDGVKRVENGDLNFEIPPGSTVELRELTNAFNRMARTVRDQRERLLRDSITDDLTGAYNHRHFRKLLKQEMDRAERTEEPLSLLMIDIDHFKAYNDSNGHEFGNEVLKRVAAILRDSLRTIDLLIRYGGDELAILLPKTDMEEARAVSERLRIAVGAQRFPGRAGAAKFITLSIGGATFPKHAHAAHELIARADDALYAAKKGGRNRVSWAVVVPAPPSSGPTAAPKPSSERHTGPNA